MSDLISKRSKSPSKDNLIFWRRFSSLDEHKSRIGVLKYFGYALS